MTTAAQTLKSLLPQWHSLLQGWAADGSLEAAAQEALMLGETPTRLKHLIDQWAAGDFRNIPEIVLLPNGDISGAMGAYAIATGKIYLNQDWLLGASAAQVISVITEELGHYLDGIFNDADTPGDEGEYFARLLSGDELSANATTELRQQQDIGAITIDGAATSSEFATTTAIRGNSLYTIFSSASWINAEAGSVSLGGHLTAITSKDEGSWIAQNLYASTDLLITAYYIGLSDPASEGNPYWSTGEARSFNLFHNDFGTPTTTPPVSGNNYFVVHSNGDPLVGGGGWINVDDTASYYRNGFSPGVSTNIKAIAEIPLISSITRTGTVREGAGLFTTSINLTAGTQTSGNLAEGSTVYWKVTGITADDLASGALTGSGVITNGKLDIQHSLVVDADAGEQFSVSVFSDSAMTQQIGSMSSVAVQEDVPILRANSLYTTVNGSSWTTAEANSVALGGHLLAIGSAEENSFVWQEFSDPSKYMVAWHGNAPNVFAHWIGLNDVAAEGSWVWSNGDALTYINSPFLAQLGVIREGFFNTSENYVVSTWNVPSSWTDGMATQGIWQDTTNTYYDQNYAPTGIAEIPLSLSITRAGATREGAGLFTISINLSAGTATSGNLAEGAQVYWKIDGITADDLGIGSAGLTGSGVIANGKLDIQHSLIQDADKGEQFTVSVYSDSAMTLQIGTSSTAAIQEGAQMIRGNSLYTIVSGPSWTEAEADSVALGGHLVTINDVNENTFIVAKVLSTTNSTVDGTWIGLTDSMQEGTWTWVDGSASGYRNWIPSQPDNFGNQDYGIIYGIGQWDDAESPFRQGLESLSGIAEVPLLISITRSGPPKEGAGLFTTSINLSAGTATSGNLAEGATVYWKIDGVTANDLSSGALTGTGVITNGKLDIQHSLGIDADTGEQFSVSVYSDSAMTQQVGTPYTVTVQETAPIIPAYPTTALDQQGNNNNTLGDIFSSTLYVYYGGNDTYAAGGDTDGVSVDFSKSEVTLTKKPDGSYSLLTPNGTVQLYNFEYLYYKDGTTDLGTPSYATTALDQQGNNNNTLGDIFSSTLYVYYGGNDTYAAGGDTDGVSVDFNKSEVTLTKKPDGSYTLLTPNGTVQLCNFEYLYYKDGTTDLGTPSYATTALDQQGNNNNTLGDIFSSTLYVYYGGNDTYVAGGDTDGVSVDFNKSQVTLTKKPDGSYSLLTPNGTVQLYDFENIYLRDATFSLTQTSPPTDLTLTSTGITENSTGGSLIGTLSATDPDAGSTFTYALATGNGTTDADNNLVTISGNQVLVKSGAVIDFETNPILNINVQVTDDGGLTYTKALTASVLDTNEAPTNLTLTSTGITENSTGGTLIGTLAATDPDAGSTLTYALVAGNGTNDADNALVEIVGSEVRVKSGAVIDFETNPILNINVQVTDNGGMTTTKAVTASVLNANEAPTDITLTSSGIAENSAGGTVIGTLSATDPDSGSVFSYSLVPGDGSTDADNNLVTISGNQLLVKPGAVIDYETNQVLNLNIQVTDNGTPPLSITKALTVNVLDVIEDITPPTVSSIAVQGTAVILNFSEQVSALAVPASAFSVQTLSSNNVATNRTITNVALDQNNSSKVILTLSGTAPASTVNLRVSYTDPAGTQSIGDVQDLAGNDLASFSNRFADTFINGSTTTLASQYQNLILTGTSGVSGTGNALANAITGNSANNTLSGLAGIDDLKGDAGNDTLIGGTGADVLTGGNGNDQFRYALTDSLLASMDRITDLVIGSDTIDGPRAVTAANLRELGAVTALTQAGIAAVLTNAAFVANGAATFSFGTGATARTFLALNNGTAGFSSTADALIEITGYSGALTNLAVI